MSAVRIAFRVSCAAAGALTLQATLAGCILGGQGTDDRFECPMAERELDDDEAISPVLGLAPSDVLSWASSSRNVNARWSDPPAGITTSSTPGPVDVVVAIERARGAAVEVVPHEACGPPHLRVPATVSFASADGQLDERVPGTLFVTREGFARVSADIDWDELQGAFEWRSAAPGVELVESSLEIVLTPMATAGAFGGAVQTRTADAVSIGPGGGGRLLHWPADSACGSAQVEREPGEQDAIYADAIARADGRAWTDAQGVEYTLAITSGATLCESEEGARSLPASVALRSADGAIDLVVDGWFVREDDQLQYHPLEQGLGGSPANFRERFGDFGLALDGHEHISLELAVTLSSTGGHAELRVIGYRDDCEQRCDARGCSGCGPFTSIPLLEVSLQQH
jgi:hypothetical protein